MDVGFLHPGAMGSSLARVVRADALWVSAGRSDASRRRADDAGLSAIDSLEELVERCDVIVSVCPPGSAAEVAERVAGAGFGGLYVDANAIAPATARTIAERFERFVDGGIIGPPVSGPGSTRLYLSGAEASTVADLWRDTDLTVRIVDGGPGAASAVKTCYATWTKGSTAMLLAIRALARAEGVEDALLAEWATSQPGLDERSRRSAPGTAAKAWRFVGEMEQHGVAFAADGLPGGFGDAAAEIYRRLADLEDADDVDLDVVITELLAD